MIGPAQSAPQPGEDFFRSRWIKRSGLGAVEQLDPSSLAPGFGAAGVHCGLKGSGGTDLGLIVCDPVEDGLASALLLTKNASAAAPIRLCRDLTEQAAIRACIVNSGNANAATGEPGLRDAATMQRLTADALGVDPSAVAVAETGVIGVPLPIDLICAAIPSLVEQADPEGGAGFSEAIMTTDRWPKRCCLRRDGVTLSAQAKGAGMIEPGFATMLCFVQTDARLGRDGESRLRGAVAESFERITVDGQMSTNDMVLLQGSGAAALPLPDGMLEAVLLQLALEIVGDGEGATRICRVEVAEAADLEEAERVARAIANSPLVKTALFGHDPNWGRIAQAAGMALAGVELAELGPDRIDAAGLGGGERESEISLRLGRGDRSARVYFSDLNHNYISINAEYTT